MGEIIDEILKIENRKRLTCNTLGIERKPNHIAEQKLAGLLLGDGKYHMEYDTAEFSSYDGDGLADIEEIIAKTLMLNSRDSKTIVMHRLTRDLGKRHSCYRLDLRWDLSTYNIRYLHPCMYDVTDILIGLTIIHDKYKQVNGLCILSIELEVVYGVDNYITDKTRNIKRYVIGNRMVEKVLLDKDKMIREMLGKLNRPEYSTKGCTIDKNIEIITVIS